jgi:hypothetical protein
VGLGAPQPTSPPALLSSSVGGSSISIRISSRMLTNSNDPAPKTASHQAWDCDGPALAPVVWLQPAPAASGSLE